VTIDGATQAATATDATGGARASGLGSLGSDAFLRLLVTQLQHQDPTRPQNDTEFIAELAQFSALEQLTSIRQSIDALNALFGEIKERADG
jgi:flagellar basal-body rod modification protein FlgD